MNQPTDPNNPFPQPTGLAVPELALPHQTECEVTKVLQNHPALRFTRLSVHQCGKDAICLEGYLETNDGNLDLCELVRGIHGIKTVVNHVLSPHMPELPSSTPKRAK